MDQHIEKFQRLLRELFQFNCADLDFGIYRIKLQAADIEQNNVKGDSFIPNARALEPVFKARMFAEVQA
jgi:hypothetical protein